MDEDAAVAVLLFFLISLSIGHGFLNESVNEVVHDFVLLFKARVRNE